MFIFVIRLKRVERMKGRVSPSNPQFQGIPTTAGHSLTGIAYGSEQSPCGYLPGKEPGRIQQEKPQAEGRPFSGVF